MNVFEGAKSLPPPKLVRQNGASEPQWRVFGCPWFSNTWCGFSWSFQGTAWRAAPKYQNADLVHSSELWTRRGALWWGGNRTSLQIPLGFRYWSSRRVYKGLRYLITARKEFVEWRVPPWFLRRCTSFGCREENCWSKMNAYSPRHSPSSRAVGGRVWLRRYGPRFGVWQCKWS